jgi:methylenetetrahydrofolate--tRNA-(uracil-5-)-methyltransferase
MTEAHRTSNFAELVCSNSLRNASMETAVGVLKEEMRRLGSIVMQAADRARVPAGAALAVDRDDFSGFITAALREHPLVEILRDDYINCPMNEAEYQSFVDAIVAAEKVTLHPFEKLVYFEGCMPIEEMARRGRMTLAFGPMRPVGLVDPRTGKRPFAVVQLRQDDREARIYNIVGFQTKMTYTEQRRVLRIIPGLQRAEFVRLGSLHRNTFIDSPRLLRPTMQLRIRDDLFVAGQMVGVEGYVESAAAGLLAAINAARLLEARPLVFPPPETALGSLVAYITDAKRRNFQPMNANYGLMPPPAGRMRGREKKAAMGERALLAMDDWIAANEIELADGVSTTAASG